MASVHDRRVVSCSMNTNATTMIPLLPIVLCVQASVAFLVHPQENISTDGRIEDVESLKHTIREQVNMILSYTEEKLRSEVLFNHLFGLETRLRQVTREHGILSTENKYLLKNTWVVRARCAIEDIEKRFTIPRVVLTNEEAKGATNDFEYSRRVREKRWKTIFHTYKDSWEIKEMITKIQSKNKNEDALNDFATDISMAFSLLSDDIHNRMFTKGMIGAPLTAHLTTNPRASSAIELLLSLFDLEPPSYAGKQVMPTLVPEKVNG